MRGGAFMAERNNQQHGVILSGGGAKGAFEVGVMLALFNGQSPTTGGVPIDPGVFCGTSVGSYNASFMASKPGNPILATVQELANIWQNRIAENAKNCGNGIFRFRGDPSDFFNLQCLTNHPLKPFTQLLQDAGVLTQQSIARGIDFVTSSEKLRDRVLDLFNLSSFVANQPLRELIQDTVDLAGIRRSDKKLRIASTNWNKGRVDIYTETDMTDAMGVQAIMASSAIPGFFPPIEINNEFHVDGGVLLNTPLSPAIRTGADTIHAIFLDPVVTEVAVEKLQNTLDTVSRLLNIQFRSNIRRNLAMVLRVNLWLRLIERATAEHNLSGDIVNLLNRGVAEIEEDFKEHYETPQLITVHCYSPRTELGGALGLLDFSQENIEKLIVAGAQVAAQHDCKESRCILPD
jgi:NTE family protein